MLGNYLLSTFRHLKKNAIYSLINLLSLVIGLSSAIIILLYANHELTYDKFHSNHEDLYILYKERITPTGTQKTYDTWVPLLNEVKSTYPEVINGTRIYEEEVVVENQADGRFEDNAIYVDSGFFDVLDFEIIRGNHDSPISSLNSVVISRSAAMKYFGTDDVVSKILEINYDQSYLVSAVIEDVPSNSSIRFDIVMLIHSLPFYSEIENYWESSFITTIVQLDKSADPADLESGFPPLIKKIWNDEVESRTRFRMLPITDSYETFIGETRNVYILLMIGIGLILIGIFNFINLSTAKATDRTKEIALRKTIGASKLQLIWQFMIEALIFSYIAIIISTLLVVILLPTINTIFDLHLSIRFLEHPEYFLILIVSGLLLAFLSGLYPAIYQAGFKNIDHLKGKNDLIQGGGYFRNILVISQFSVSTILIISAIAIFQQIRYMENNNRAFNKENALIIPVGMNDFEGTPDDSIRLKTFKDKLKEHNAITSLTSSVCVPSQWINWFTFVKPREWEGDPLRMRITYTDASYFETFQIPVIEGRTFNPDALSEQSETVVINEAAKQAFNWHTINDKYIYRGDQQYKVIGVVENYNLESLKNEVPPLLHFFRVPENGVHRLFTLRYRSGNQQEILEYIRKQWKTLDQSRPIDYVYLESSVAAMYNSDKRLFNLIFLFSWIAVLIAAMGLIGLSFYYIAKKKKEIVIRKVYGASLKSIISLLTKRYIRIFLIVILISIPVSNYFITEWLNDFAHKMNVNTLIFIIPSIFILLVAFLSIGYQTMSASRTNPADSLRYE